MSLLHFLREQIVGSVVVSDFGNGSYEILMSDGSRRMATPTEISAARPLAARAAIRPVSARQMLLALDEAGLLSTIETYVSTQPKAVKISWSRTQGFERNDPMLNTGAKALGMTDEQIDNLFQLAASK